MKVVEAGHVYDLNWLDGEPQSARPLGDLVGNVLRENRLIFVKREGPGYPGNVGAHAGTNLQEVLRAMIDRVKYLNAQIPDVANLSVVNDLRHALWLLEVRAAKRHGRLTPIYDGDIESRTTCVMCGHVECQGGCRAHHSANR